MISSPRSRSKVNALDNYLEPLTLISSAGARVYYLRNVLHDWPDDMCRLILSHLASAMTPGYSKILANELVLPDQGCGIIAAQVDITMMACVAAEERSETQWHELVDSAGLKIEEIWTDVPEAESVMELGLK